MKVADMLFDSAPDGVVDMVPVPVEYDVLRDDVMGDGVYVARDVHEPDKDKVRLWVAVSVPQGVPLLLNVEWDGLTDSVAVVEHECEVVELNVRLRVVEWEQVPDSVGVGDAVTVVDAAQLADKDREGDRESVWDAEDDAETVAVGVCDDTLRDKVSTSGGECVRVRDRVGDQVSVVWRVKECEGDGLRLSVDVTVPRGVKLRVKVEYDGLMVLVPEGEWQDDKLRLEVALGVRDEGLLLLVGVGERVSQKDIVRLHDVERDADQVRLTDRERLNDELRVPLDVLDGLRVDVGKEVMDSLVVGVEHVLDGEGVAEHVPDGLGLGEPDADDV